MNATGKTFIIVYSLEWQQACYILCILRRFSAHGPPTGHVFDWFLANYINIINGCITPSRQVM